MKRFALIVVLILVVGIAFSWNLAAAESEAASEEIASVEPTVAEPSSSRASLDEPVSSPLVGVANSSEQTCTAELDCEDGNVISCTGTNQCAVNHFFGYVECDGQRTTCPNFCEAKKLLDCGSCGDYLCSCTSLSGDCQVSSGGVTCDGQFTPCSCPLGCF